MLNNEKTKSSALNVFLIHDPLYILFAFFLNELLTQTESVATGELDLSSLD